MDAYEVGKNSASGNVILDLEGQEVALVVGKTLYVLFDLPHLSSEGTSETARKVLELILDDYFLLIDDRERFATEMKCRGSVSKAKVRFRHYYLRSKRSKEVTPDQLAYLQREVSSNKSLLLDVVRQWHQLFQSSVRKNYTDQEAETVYNNLCALSSTGRIGVFNQLIIFPVGQVDNTYGNKRYDIGELVIVLDLFKEKVEDGIKCYNLTRTVNDHAHPHINNNGDFCLGNISDVCDEFYRNGEIVLLILVLMDFLRVYNNANPYKRVWLWPQYDDPENGE